MELEFISDVPSELKPVTTTTKIFYEDVPITIKMPNRMSVELSGKNATDLSKYLNNIFGQKLYIPANGSAGEKGYSSLFINWKDNIIKSDLFKAKFTAGKPDYDLAVLSKAGLSAGETSPAVTDEVYKDEGQTTTEDDARTTRTRGTALSTISTRSILQELPSYEDRVAFLKTIKSISKTTASKLMDDYRKAILSDPQLDKGETLTRLFDLAKLEREDADLEQRNVPYVLKEKSVVYNPIELRKRGPSKRY